MRSWLRRLRLGSGACSGQTGDSAWGERCIGISPPQQRMALRHARHAHYTCDAGVWRGEISMHALTVDPQANTCRCPDHRSCLRGRPRSVKRALGRALATGTVTVLLILEMAACGQLTP